MNEVLPCVCLFVSGFAPLISVLIFHLQGFCAINEIKDKQMHIAYFSQEKKVYRWTALGAALGLNWTPGFVGFTVRL